MKGMNRPDFKAIALTLISWREDKVREDKVDDVIAALMDVYSSGFADGVSAEILEPKVHDPRD